MIRKNTYTNMKLRFLNW